MPKEESGPGAEAMAMTRAQMAVGAAGGLGGEGGAGGGGGGGGGDGGGEGALANVAVRQANWVLGGERRRWYLLDGQGRRILWVWLRS